MNELLETENITLTRTTKRVINPKFQKLLEKTATFDEKILIRDKVNQVIGSSPTKLWYEIITNIQNETKLVIFEITLTDEGLKVVYKQDSLGPTFELYTENSISKNIIQNGKLVLIDKKNSSSVYGSGYVTIGQYASMVVITSNDSNGDSWKFNILTKDFEEVEPLEDCNFKIELLIPYNTKMGGWKNYVTQLKNIIQEVDSRNIVNGREYKFTVNGMGTTTDNQILSEKISPKIVPWVDEIGTPQSTCRYTTFKINGNETNQIVIQSPSCNEDIESITFEITSIGKIDSSYKLSGFSGDKPMLVVYYKGTNQICFMMPIRSGNGQTSLNNVLVEAEVDKKEIGLFLQSTDKSTGITPLLKNELLEIFNNLILEKYPDTELVELMVQLFVIDMFINDTTILGDKIRTDAGLEAMNSLDVSIRRDIVKPEISKDSGRYDIVVDMIWETNMELIPETPRFVGEVKKQNFGRNDRNQVFAYTIKDSLITKACGISVDITPAAQKAYGTDIDSIKRAGSLPNVNFSKNLIDVTKFNFKSPAVYQYWLNEAKKNLNKN